MGSIEKLKAWWGAMRQEQPESDNPKSEDELFKNARNVAALVVVGAIGVLIAYLLNLALDRRLGSSAQWGEFGDFIGGVVNPLVGLGTVLLIVFSIALQRRELKASVVELKAANEATKLQNFESSLFAWLNTYHEMIGSMREVHAHGRQAMVAWHEMFFRYRVARDAFFSANKGMTMNAGSPLTKQIVSEALEELEKKEPKPTSDEWLIGVEVFNRSCAGFESLYARDRWQLDAVFRTLFRMLHWIDTSDLTTDQKWHYVALVRAQLSWIEMIFVFYDSLTEEGAKLAKVVNKYALLDNLAPETDLMVKIYRERIALFGGERDEVRAQLACAALTPEAFSSEMARARMKAVKENVPTLG